MKETTDEYQEIENQEIKDETEDEDKTEEAKINVWYGQGGSIGHVSLTTNKNNYLSMWPNFPIFSPKQLFFNSYFGVKAKTKTLLEDGISEATEYRSPDGSIIRNRTEADGSNYAQDTQATAIPRLPDNRITIKLTKKESNIVEKNVRDIDDSIKGGKLKYCIKNQTDECVNCIGAVKKAFKDTSYHDLIPNTNGLYPIDFSNQLEENLKEKDYNQFFSREKH